MQIIRRDFYIDFVSILLITLFLAITVISTQTARDLLIFDGGWYANRADQIWRGYLGDTFVYTLGYPLSVGTLNLLIDDVVTASLVFNSFMAFLIFMGTYLLGSSYYHRQVGLLAVVLLALNPSIYAGLREIQPPTLFYCLVIFSFVIHRYLTLYPSITRAVLLGIIVTAAMYTRLEGVILTLLFLLAAIQIYWQSKNWQQAVSLLVVATVPFAIGFIFFMIIGFSGSNGGGSAASIADILISTPLRWDLLSRRFTDALIVVIYQWQAWVLLMTAISIIQFSKDFLRANVFLVLSVAYYIFCVFVLTIWPFQLRAQYFNPIIAILVAWAFWRLFHMKILNRWMLASLILLATLPGFSYIIQQVQETSPLAYQQSEITLQTSNLDQWIIEQGWQGSEFYAFCDEMMPFTEHHFHSMFRLIIGEPVQTHPETVIHNMIEGEDFLVVCHSDIPYNDWSAYLSNSEQHNFELISVGIFEHYEFYQAVQRD